MFIDSSGKRVNIHAPYGGRSQLDTPEIRAEVGVIEIAEPAAPEDYNDKLYYRQEIDVAPYVIYTRKSQQQIDAANYEEGMAKIRAIEQAELLPRPLREFLLEQPDAAQKPWFSKINKLHLDIETLKASLPPKPI